MSLPIMCRSAGQNRRKAVRLGIGEADAGQVIGQCVHPDVHHVVGMVGHLYAPVERRAGDRQVAQSAGHEADHLVAPDVGADELRVRLVMGEQPVGIGRQLEEVGLFLGPCHRRPSLGGDANSVGADGRLGLGEEALVANRVPPFVRVQVDVAGGVHPLPDVDRRLDVVGIGGADESVVGDAQLVLQPLEHIGISSGQLCGRNALGRSGLGHLQAVLVGTGQIAHVVTVQPLETGDGVGGDVFVCVPDVRSTVRVRDRCRYVVRLAHFHPTLWCACEQ